MVFLDSFIFINNYNGFFVEVIEEDNVWYLKNYIYYLVVRIYINFCFYIEVFSLIFII